MVFERCKDKDALALVKYISEDEREENLTFSIFNKNHILIK
jgi:hypothetical protein